MKIAAEIAQISAFRDLLIARAQNMWPGSARALGCLVVIIGHCANKTTFYRTVCAVCGALSVSEKFRFSAKKTPARNDPITAQTTEIVFNN